MIESIGCAAIRCPHCRGVGHLEERGGCPVCAEYRGPYFELRGYLELPISPEIAERIYAHAPTDSETYDLVWDAQADDEQWEREKQAEREAEAAAEDSITELARARRRAEEREQGRADYLYDLIKDERVTGGRR